MCVPLNHDNKSKFKKILTWWIGRVYIRWKILNSRISIFFFVCLLLLLVHLSTTRNCNLLLFNFFRYHWRGDILIYPELHVRCNLIALSQYIFKWNFRKDQSSERSTVNQVVIRTPITCNYIYDIYVLHLIFIKKKLK